MKKKAIIFGTGTLAELVNFYLDNDSTYHVVAFCSTDLETETFCGKPVINFLGIEEKFSPSDHEMFIAIGYRQMNTLRKEFCEQSRSKGYKLLSYISSKATCWNKNNVIGDNVFIFENNNIQPFVQIEDGVILWSGNHIGHHSKLKAYSFLTSHVVVSGFCTIGEQSFLGVNSTIADNLTIGYKALVGAGAVVTKSLSEGQVIVSQKSTLLNRSSDYFLR
ncbi:MAG: hypothetical protein B7Y25_00230 [Alphaproteobacteria bacterium 16-39-46]|nr:MAG: hypothetical protein B7Y25_00230 [Alphaproteobacteria bacterium 16-39-46]OZA44516.1 MAG: hypothetical protein B7X84_00090 [Alphaproteobacteria bacterium 17-39-52]HQS83363.1 acetyltransferase [Alphaproteobacteria bacterium]HQS93050.1 acetyltransferase [Alphaproteobacteria bacterium]